MFALWIQNTAGINHLPGGKPSNGFRADMLGQFIWKYSEDRGVTWSTKHYVIPVPKGHIERINTWNGTVQMMWEVDHIKQHKGWAMFGFTKIGTYAVAQPEEIFFMASPNLLIEDDPTKVTWQMWPDADRGVQAVGGTSAAPSGISEEPHITPLLAVDAYQVVFRTSQGYLGSAQSQVGNPRLPWHQSSYAQYLPLDNGTDWLAEFPNASALKNPRGPISPKRQSNGVILMTYYNNGGFGAFAHRLPVSDRNNMWLTAGYEINGTIMYSQPELVLYDRAREKGHGYPDVITDVSGRIYITETYKMPPASTARTHAVDPGLAQMLFGQRHVSGVPSQGLVRQFSGMGKVPITGVLPDFSKYPTNRYGFTLALWVSGGFKDGALFATVATQSAGALQASVGVAGLSNGTAVLTMVDNEHLTVTSKTDPVCSARLKSTGPHSLTIIADGGPKMVLWVVDGHLCDGGPFKYAWGPGAKTTEGTSAGWTLFDQGLGDVGGGSTTGDASKDVVKGYLYNRALYVTEAIGIWRHGIH